MKRIAWTTNPWGIPAARNLEGSWLRAAKHNFDTRTYLYVIYSIAEYNNAIPQTFLGEIKRTGQVIYTHRRHRMATTRRRSKHKA